jgi:hypothetical protein
MAGFMDTLTNLAQQFGQDGSGQTSAQPAKGGKGGGIMSQLTSAAQSAVGINTNQLNQGIEKAENLVIMDRAVTYTLYGISAAAALTIAILQYKTYMKTYGKKKMATASNPRRSRRNPARLGSGKRMKSFVSRCVAGARSRGFRPHKYKTLAEFCKATGAKMGRRKYGKGAFQKMAAKGLRRAIRKGYGHRPKHKVIHLGRVSHARRAAANPEDEFAWAKKLPEDGWREALWSPLERRVMDYVNRYEKEHPHATLGKLADVEREYKRSQKVAALKKIWKKGSKTRAKLMVLPPNRRAVAAVKMMREM